MSEKEIKELENTIAVNNDYKKHYHLCDYFEVELIDKLLKQFKQLQQENQKLKEQLEKKYKEVGTLTNEILYEENTKLLSVLDEIREYLEKDYSFAKRGDIPLMSRAEQLAGNLFKILDVVRMGEENQKKLHTSNGNKFTKYELLDDYERILQENQQLKESYCNRTDCSGRLHDSRKYPSVKQQLDLYKSILDEIREYIEKDIYYCLASGDNINIYLDNLLQILDKVK